MTARVVSCCHKGQKRDPLLLLDIHDLGHHNVKRTVPAFNLPVSSLYSMQWCGDEWLPEADTTLATAHSETPGRDPSKYSEEFRISTPPSVPEPWLHTTQFYSVSVQRLRNEWKHHKQSWCTGSLEKWHADPSGLRLEPPLEPLRPLALVQPDVAVNRGGTHCTPGNKRSTASCPSSKTPKLFVVLGPVSCATKNHHALNINSYHSLTKFLQPANLTTYTILSLFSLQVQLALRLLPP